MSKSGMVPVGDIILIGKREHSLFLRGSRMWSRQSMSVVPYTNWGNWRGELTGSTWRCAVVILLLAIYWLKMRAGNFLRISPVKRHLYTTPVCGRLHGWLWLAAKRLALITPSWHYALRVTALKLKLPMAVGPMALVIIMDLLTDFIRATT